ncbi:MAG: serine hydrolase [Deltaproteobacteria bacterium]|nr:serine hydrolase [Deltaproteobacteria bacterium]
MRPIIACLFVCVLLSSCAGRQPQVRSEEGDIGQSGSPDAGAPKLETSEEDEESAPVTEEEIATVRRGVLDSVISSYNSGNPEQFVKDFNAQMNAALPVEKLKPFIDELRTTFGKIVSIEDPISPQKDVYIYPAEFEKAPMIITIAYDDKNKVAGLFFKPGGPHVEYPEITQDTTLESIAKPYIDVPETAGLVIGIYRNGKTEVHGFGVVDKNTNTKPDDKTLFEIGSITKTFTTALLLDLVNRKIVSMNDPVKAHLPNTVKMPSNDSKEITLFNLATHSSSLPRLPSNFPQTVKDPKNPYQHYTIKHSFEFLSSFEIEEEIGSKSSYSNFGMGLLGYILASKTSQTYEELLKKRLLKKIGMRDTTITLSKKQASRLAAGYDMKGEPAPPWDLTDAFAGAGAIRSTARDMLKFLTEAMCHKKGKLKEIFEEATTPTMPSPLGKIGLAWMISPLDKQKSHEVVWHNGGTGGYRSYLGFVKEANVGVVVLSNSQLEVDTLGSLVLKYLLLSEQQ